MHTVEGCTVPRPPTPAPTTPPPTLADEAEVASLRRSGPLGDGSRRDDDWLDDLEPDRPRRRLSLVLSVLPWLVVAALLLLPGRLGAGATSEQAATDAPSAATEPTTGPDASEAPAEEARAGRGDDPAVQRDARGSDPGTGPDLQLAAAATIVARSWLTGVEPTLEVVGLEPDPPVARYAEHLVVETIDAAGNDRAVVTLLAVVLSGDGWLDAEVLRVAVPLVVEPTGPRAAGSPWLLPAPMLASTSLELEPLEDPDLLLAAHDALVSAGFVTPVVLALRASSDGVVVVELDDPDAPAVWLHPTDDGFRVAGAPTGDPTTELAP